MSPPQIPKSAMYRDAAHLIQRLAGYEKTEATKKLTQYYTYARFKGKESLGQIVDGGDDGGIDYFLHERSYFFILQSKYSSKVKEASEREMTHEINKLKNTLGGQNPNKNAQEFVQFVNQETNNEKAILEIVWLTTNIVRQSLRDRMQNNLNTWIEEKGWKITVDFVVIDKQVLEGVIYDVNHGYVPQTGEKIIRLEKGQWFSDTSQNDVYSIVGTVNVNNILSWFSRNGDIDDFLQKNVRGFIGDETKVNRGMANSYLDDPTWFWYKHNGIIIFADQIELDEEKDELILRNPQVVNGGQTLKTLFMKFSKKGRVDNGARVLLRAYRIPSENTETYKRSIEIIAALNSQNKILPSDLHSTDPRQVRLEQLLDLAGGYKYHRRRSKGDNVKSSRFSIPMTKLALRFYVCKTSIPSEGVRGGVERIFEEGTRYEKVFPENLINYDLGGNHIVLDYGVVWNIDQNIRRTKKPKEDEANFQYTQWYMLDEVYQRLKRWKNKRFTLGWEAWIDFVQSIYFQTATENYSKLVLKRARRMIPKDQNVETFFKGPTAKSRFAKCTRGQRFESLVNKAYTRFKENRKE